MVSAIHCVNRFFTEKINTKSLNSRYTTVKFIWNKGLVVLKFPPNAFIIVDPNLYCPIY